MMSWEGLARIEAQLSEELASFDWAAATATCDALIARIHVEPDLLPEASAKRLMQKLRRKRRFGLMAQLAEALLHSGQDTPHIRRQYAQALIDLGLTTAPELVLNTLLTTDERVDASGLEGRIYKQLYVNSSDGGNRRTLRFLERAYDHYIGAFQADPNENIWHGINAVALAERGRRDGASFAREPDASELAQRILATVAERERSSQVRLAPWDLAIRLEALIALGRHHEAESAALEYAASEDADAFELGSTLRQLTEVCQLSDVEPPGSSVLPILRAALLRREGADLQRTPSEVRDEIKQVDAARQDLERVFGADRTQTLSWYRAGLKRCESIARIERLDGRGHGTGWVVNAGTFFPCQEKRLLVLTNAHVVSAEDYPNALRPSATRVNFQVLQRIYEIEDVVWSSPVGELDATFLSLRGGPPLADPLPVEENQVMMGRPPPRLYIVGHPGGRDVEFSLQDNYLLACNERVLHYRTPTEPGSSGSPVFEPHGWRVVALHHAGSHTTQRIDGEPGSYEANVGIAIRAIRSATGACD